MNTYDGPVPSGVPNPFGPMLHSYPTRYHGPIYTRPMFGFPWRERPNDFARERGLEGLGVEDVPSGTSDGLKALLVLGLIGGVVILTRNL